MARPDQIRELLLAEALVHPELDQQPCDLATARRGGLLGAVLRALPSASGISIAETAYPCWERGEHSAKGLPELTERLAG